MRRRIWDCIWDWFKPKTAAAVNIPGTEMSWRRLPPAPSAIQAVGYRRLKPKDVRIQIGALGDLVCDIAGDSAPYHGVFTGRMFPVRYATDFIVLFYVNAEEIVKEIGVLENLDGTIPQTRELILKSLAMYYHEQFVTRVHQVCEKHDFLFFDVETQRDGRCPFIMPWRVDRAVEYGEKGKLLLDAYWNRYIIRDLDSLPPRDRRAFKRYIYW